METLGKLFGGATKVKIMRLFILNPELALETKRVAKRSRVATTLAAREIHLLHSIGFLIKRTKGREIIWQLDPNFVFLNQLRGLLKNNVLSRRKELARQFARCGRLNLLVVAGVLLEQNDGRADLLLVGDRLNKSAVDRLIKNLEAEIGRELRYAVLETADFTYRLNASDKFVRDIFDYPHQVIVDKIAVRSSYPQQIQVGV